MRSRLRRRQVGDDADPVRGDDLEPAVDRPRAGDQRVRIAPGGTLKYSRRSPRRRDRRTKPAVSRARAAPLIAPRLARSVSASSAAVCSAGSQMSSQASIRPAIGVMPSEPGTGPSPRRSACRSFMPDMLVPFRMFSQY